ncbi:MAG: 2-dehydropantoate 2-reductase [Myxococcales bacterium]|nr:2-dehydropantoate 2-reductase [Myxococcales bacterium]
MMEIRHIRILGPGGVGGYYGGRLARLEDLTVDFVGRGEHARAIAAKGLRVRSWRGDFHVRVTIHERIPADGAADLLLVAVKSTSLEPTLPELAATLSPRGVVLPLLNGLDAEERIAAHVGRARVLGGMAFIGSGIVEPGVVEHVAHGAVGIGELEGPPTPRIETVQALFERAGIEARAVADLKTAKWIKLAWNDVFNPTTALTGLPVGGILGAPGLREIAHALFSETQAVAAAEGVKISEDIRARYLGGLPDLDAYRPSMLQDAQAGKPMEVDAILGALIERADRLGIAVPVNRTLYALLKGVEASRGR